MQPSEMTNEKILSLAELCFFEDHSVEEDQQTAAVLRDYSKWYARKGYEQFGVNVSPYKDGEIELINEETK